MTLIYTNDDQDKVYQDKVIAAPFFLLFWPGAKYFRHYFLERWWNHWAQSCYPVSSGYRNVTYLCTTVILLLYFAFHFLLITINYCEFLLKLTLYLSYPYPSLNNMPVNLKETYLYFRKCKLTSVFLNSICVSLLKRRISITNREKITILKKWRKFAFAVISFSIIRIYLYAG